MTGAAQGLAVVTGGSSGIGYQLARRAAEDGYPLLLCADEPELEDACDKLRRLGATVETVRADLATETGLRELWSRIEPHGVDLLFANAGRTLGDKFHDEEWPSIKRLIELNVTQTTALVHKVGRKMRAQGRGRILITGSIAGFVPGSYMAVYNATKAYLDSFAHAIHDETRESGVTVTCLMPGLTETDVFDRADMEDTPLAELPGKDHPAEVARAGYEAMMRGEPALVPGIVNRTLAMFSDLVPDAVLARIHRAAAKPDEERKEPPDPPS